MEVGEEDLSLANLRILRGDRLLDLHDHLCRCPDLIRRGQDCCPGADVVGIRDRGTNASISLDHDLMAAAYELIDTCRGYRHPEFVVLDLLGDPDLHDFLLVPCPRMALPR